MARRNRHPEHPSAQPEAALRRGIDDYPRPCVTVDVALVTADRGALRALLVQRDEPPFEGAWALVGGFVGADESLDDAAARVLAQKAGIEGVFVEQLYTFGAVDRDPRTRVISVAHYALVPARQLAEPTGGARLAELALPRADGRGGEPGGPVAALDENGAPLDLAFDHAEVLGVVVQRLRGKLDYAPIGFELLPERFTLRALQEIHETIRGEALNKDSFRRRMLASGRIEATGEREKAVGHRPAELYRFSQGSKR